MVLIVSVVLLTGGVVALHVYADPTEATTSNADVAFVLGPPSTAAVNLAEELLADGSVGSVVLSVPREMSFPAECELQWLECRRPEPSTTEGEAALLDAYAEATGARSAIVIAPNVQVERARFTFDKCATTAASVVGLDLGLSYKEFVYFSVYQTASWIKTAVTPCGTFDF